MYGVFRIWVVQTRRVGAESCLSAFFTYARKSRRIEFAAKNEKAPRRAPVRPSRTLRNEGAVKAPLVRRRGIFPPGFKVAMPGSPQIVRNVAFPSARPGFCWARAAFSRRRRARLTSGERPLPPLRSSSQIFPSSINNVGAQRQDFERSFRAFEAARARPKRVRHAQQDDYRRVTSGRDPGRRSPR